MLPESSSIYHEKQVITTRYIYLKFKIIFYLQYLFYFYEYLVKGIMCLTCP